MQITLPRGYTQHFGQQTAALLHAEAVPTVRLSGELVRQFAFDTTLPRGTCIVLTLSGDKRVPFVVITNYGSEKLVKYQREVGHIFEIVVEGDSVAEEQRPDVVQETLEGVSNA
jgi:hypothetical protein